MPLVGNFVDGNAIVLFSSDEEARAFAEEHDACGHASLMTALPVVPADSLRPCREWFPSGDGVTRSSRPKAGT